MDIAAIAAIAVPGVATLLYVGRSLEAMRALVASNRDQGERIGKLEDWKAATLAVAEYKASRTLSRAHGVPITESDETPT